jgi:hypothetical protein
MKWMIVIQEVVICSTYVYGQVCKTLAYVNSIASRKHWQQNITINYGYVPHRNEIE